MSIAESKAFALLETSTSFQHCPVLKSLLIFDNPLCVLNRICHVPGLFLHAVFVTVFIQRFVNKNSPFCPDILEEESHFLFCCPVSDDARRKYLSHIIVPDTVHSLNSVFDNARTEQLRKLAMFVFLCFKT